MSFYGGRGKRTAWDTWKAYKYVTQAFCALATSPTSHTIEEWLGLLERFVVLMYNQTSSHASVNEARKQLFTQKGNQLMDYPLHKLHLFNTSRGLPTKLVTAGQV